MAGAANMRFIVVCLFIVLGFCEGDGEVIGQLKEDVVDESDRAERITDAELELMPTCKFYDRHAESCDPFVSVGTCRYCKTQKKTLGKITLGQQQCPTEDSIVAAHRTHYYWHLAHRKYGNYRICAIVPRYTTVAEHHANLTAQTALDGGGGAATTEAQQLHNTALYIAAGLGVLVVLVALIVCVHQR